MHHQRLSHRQKRVERIMRALLKPAPLGHIATDTERRDQLALPVIQWRAAHIELQFLPLQVAQVQIYNRRTLENLAREDARLRPRLVRQRLALLVTHIQQRMALIARKSKEFLPILLSVADNLHKSRI